MLQTKEKFLQYLININLELSKISFSDDLRSIINSDDLKKAIHDAELIIPVIGAFSSGKSSLINSFLGHDFLPVGLTPETALASELRYSTDERIEAVLPDESFKRYNIHEIKNVSESASLYKYMRVYLHNEAIRLIEPLVLVDMPGFEAPSALHNRAIAEYLSKGVSYVVLISVLDGTATRSLLRRLKEISDIGKPFHVFVSKANLRSEGEIKEVGQKVQEQIEEYLGISSAINAVGNNGGETLNGVLHAIDPEKVFYEIFIESLKSNYYAILENIDIHLSSLQRTKTENDDIRKGLRDSIDNLIAKRDSLIEEAKNKYVSINSIVDDIGNEINNNIDEIASLCLNNKEIDGIIAEIIRGSLFKTLGRIKNQTIDNFVVYLSKELKDLGSTSSQINVNPIVDNALKQLTSVLGKTPYRLNPFVELLLTLIPSIVALFVNSKERKKQGIIDKLRNEFIPGLKAEMRSKLPAVISEYLTNTVNATSAEFENLIKEKEQIVEASQKEVENKSIDIKKTISECEQAKVRITEYAKMFILQKEV